MCRICFLNLRSSINNRNKLKKEKITIKFVKQEFIIFVGIMNIYFNNTTAYDSKKHDCFELLFQFEFIKMHQRLIRLLIPIKEKYNLRISITEACIIYDIIDVLNLKKNNDCFIKVLFIKINNIIYKEVIL